jgi:hypothetical protein
VRSSGAKAAKSSSRRARSHTWRPRTRWRVDGGHQVGRHAPARGRACAASRGPGRARRPPTRRSPGPRAARPGPVGRVLVPQAGQRRHLPAARLGAARRHVRALVPRQQGGGLREVATTARRARRASRRSAELGMRHATACDRRSASRSTFARPGRVVAYAPWRRSPTVVRSLSARGRPARGRPRPAPARARGHRRPARARRARRPGRRAASARSRPPSTTSRGSSCSWWSASSTPASRR